MEDTAEGIETGVDGDGVADTSGVATIEGDVSGSVSGGDVANVADGVVDGLDTDASAGQGGWRFTCLKKINGSLDESLSNRMAFFFGFWMFSLFNAKFHGLDTMEALKCGICMRCLGRRVSASD